MTPRVNYITNIAPHYRSLFWEKLLEEKSLDFHFYYGDSKNIKTINFKNINSDIKQSKIHYIKNYRFKKILIWQKGVLSHIFQNNGDVYIFLGDMYVFTTWLSVIILKLKKRPVIFWGHGMYGNEGVFKKHIRHVFNKLADKHLLYGNYAKNLMVKNGFDGKNIEVVYNSLDYDMHFKYRKTVINKDFYKLNSFFKINNLPVLIFIGRLTPEKQLTKLIQAVKQINDQEPRVNLMIVGEGIEKNKLEDFSKHLQGQIYFYGACYDEKIIGHLLANATLCVSPGNVGLTAIHSLSYGTPVCTHNDMQLQMPEAEAIIHGETGVFFDRESSNLKETILYWLNSSQDREQIRENCYKIIDEKYNPYTQLDLFKKVIFNLIK